jgi:hypothetical protein
MVGQAVPEATLPLRLLVVEVVQVVAMMKRPLMPMTLVLPYLSTPVEVVLLVLL